MTRLPSIRTMRKAFAEKDAAFDGTFFVGVKTTGIFCRPVCRAKPPRPENVVFYPTAQEAIRAGFRPCKLCKPLDPARPPQLVRRLMDLIEHEPGRVTERDLRTMGIDPTTARRQFRATLKTTFTKWQRSQRIGQAMQKLNDGANMTTAQITAGFESASGFRDAMTRLFGSSESRAAARTFTADWLSTPLGPMLAVADDRGLVMLDFADNNGFEHAALRMKRKLANGQGECAIVPGKSKHLAQLKAQLAEYFAGARKDFSIPLSPHGTDFELRVWDYLRKIPYGETRTYGRQAQAIGNPAGSRAVGAANGRNDISILIPCHRVIGATGSLVGYGGGLERKRWLLNHERKIAGGELF